MKNFKKVLFILISFMLVTSSVFCEKVRRKMSDGRYRFVELIAEDTYDENGQIIHSVDKFNTECTYSYDDNGNLVSKQKKRENENGFSEVKADYWSYDENGNLTYEKKSDRTGLFYEYDEDSNLIKVTEETTDNPRCITYEYENGNMIYENNEIDDNQIIYEYDQFNNMVHSIDIKDYEKFYYYDWKNRLISVQDKNNKVLENYEYYSNDQVKVVRIPAKNWYGHEYYAKYDALGNLLRKEDNGHTYIYEYSENGTLLKEIEQYYDDEFQYMFEYDCDENGKVSKKRKFLTYKGIHTYK